MRPIKFRAWDNEAQCFREASLAHGSGWALTIAPGRELEPWEQYTGLTDKNGTEIFEGDIVKGSAVSVVEWSHDICDEYNCVGWGGLQSGYGGLPTGQDIEVIGNVHENPELLRKEQS